MQRSCTVIVGLLAACAPHVEPIERGDEYIPPEEPPLPTEVATSAAVATWAVPIGNAGAQGPGPIAVATDGTVFALAHTNFACTAVTQPEPAKLCHEGPGVLGIDLLVAHEPTGALRFVRRVDDPQRWSVLDLGVLADGRVALLTAPRRQLHGEPAPQPGFTQPAVRIVDPDDGSARETIALDLDADPGVGAFVVLPDGDLALSGSFVGELRFGDERVRGGEDDDVFVARLDPQGALRWLSTARGDTPGLSGQDGIARPYLLADGSLLAVGRCRGRPLRFDRGPQLRCGGKRRDDAFVAKWNAEGSVAWARHIEGTLSGSKWIGLGATPYAVAELSDRSLVVAGIFSHTITFEDPGGSMTLAGRGFADAFIVHYDADGRLLDAWQIAGPGNDRVVDLQADGMAVWLVGTLAGDSALGSNWQPNHRFRDHDPDNLRLDEHGYLARLDLRDGTRHMLPLPTEHRSHLHRTSPEQLRASADRLLVAGNFTDDGASFPLFDGSWAWLPRRVEPRENYETFLWSIAWDRLHARVAELPRGGRLD